MKEKQNKTILRHLPNFITSLNLLCGSIAVVLLLETNADYSLYAGVLIFFAAVLDFLDGLIARVLNAYSDMGKELDSLADLISFGLVPGIIAFRLLKESMTIINTPVLDASLTEQIILLSAFLIPVFSGLRLAKFNVDTRQTESFIGLPTPSNAIFWASLIIIYSFYHPVFHLTITNVNFLLISIVVFSGLLVSNLPMFSLKVKNFSIKDNLIRYIFLGISLILLILLWIKGFNLIIGVPIIIILYIFISIIDAIIKKIK